MIGIPKSYQITTGCLPKPFNFRHRFSTKKLLRPMYLVLGRGHSCHAKAGLQGREWVASLGRLSLRIFQSPLGFPSKPREINHRSIEVISKSLSNHLISSIHQPIHQSINPSSLPAMGPWQVQALPRQQSFSSAVEESERVEPPTREQLHRPWWGRRVAGLQGWMLWWSYLFWWRGLVELQCFR